MTYKPSTEEEYKLLTQEEQILLRPDTVIGSIVDQTKQIWAIEDVKDFSNLKISKQELTYIPGFLKLYDEIITNASDHAQRNKGVTTIKISIDENWKICVYNDGDGIPIVKHKEHNIYIPEMILGKLNSGSNYNDSQERYGAGRNGIGSGAVNLFSSLFVIDCADGTKSYYQEYSNNAKIKTEPIIKTSKKSYTSVSYITDFDRLPIVGFENDTMKLCIKRAIDIAAYNPTIKVYFNNNLIKVNNIKDWCNLHLDNQEELFTEDINDKWSIGLAQSQTDIFEHCSIVNGNTTWIGGTHVDYIINQVVKRLTEDLTKGNKKIKIKPIDIKNRFHLFLIAKIANPTFDTQTKENLTIKITDKFELSDKLYKALLKSDIVKSILEWIQLREQSELNKLNKTTGGKTLRIDKLVDAHKAGTKDNFKCSMILAEGDCLDENTKIKVFKNGDYIDILLKDANVGDMVITHNGNIRQIYGITKKVKECKTIYYNNTSITGSNEHRLLVYNKSILKFEYLEIDKIDKNIHQLVKSKLFNMESLYSIKKIEMINDDKFKYKIYLNDSIIESSDTHKFTILNLDKNKFELVEAKHLKQNNLIISISPSA